MAANLKHQKSQSKLTYDRKSFSATNVNQRSSPNTNTTNNSKAKGQRFSNCIRSTPFSFVTNGLRLRKRSSLTNGFAYDLSKDEHHFMANFKSPMKDVPINDKELLQSGQREAYLTRRYEFSPDWKYNFPEATSWRIGWFHTLSDSGVA